MTCTEMSNEFDLIFNNIMSNQAPGIDEYEKSVFLTKAQNEIILDYFSPKGNKFQEGFDGSERRQIDFSNIIFVEEKSLVTGSTGNYTKLDGRSSLFKVPVDALLIINESLVLTKTNERTYTLAVIPISYVEYTRMMMKPYKLPAKSQAWRLLNSTSVGDNVGPYSEIIYNSGAYSGYTPVCNVRYVKRPSPIVLINLEDAYSDVSIDGVTAQTPCSLDEIIHRDIVQRAAELAKAAYTGDLTTQIQVGNVSATNLGVVSSSNDRRER